MVRKHLVHILTRVAFPSFPFTVILCTFAVNLLFVWRIEWLTLLPAIPDFKHTSHLIMNKTITGYI